MTGSIWPCDHGGHRLPGRLDDGSVQKQAVFGRTEARRGASKSPLWCQITADISGLPVRVPAVADLACVGAAILAGVGTGIYQNAEEGYKHLAIDERVIMPDPERSAEYRRLLPAYKRSVQALGDVYGL